MKFKCPRCGSKNVVIVIQVPWSTDGLIPKQKIFLKCEDCGYTMPIEKLKNKENQK